MLYEEGVALKASGQHVEALRRLDEAQQLIKGAPEDMSDLLD